MFGLNYLFSAATRASSEWPVEKLLKKKLDGEAATLVAEYLAVTVVYRFNFRCATKFICKIFTTSFIFSNTNLEKLC